MHIAYMHLCVAINGMTDGYTLKILRGCPWRLNREVTKKPSYEVTRGGSKNLET